MKHFLVEARYLVPYDKIKEVQPRHRVFLQKGYDAGLFLVSGPQVDPPVGGFLMARAESKADLEAIFSEEPFYAEKLASYTFTEFSPVKRQPWTDSWFGP